MTMANNAKPATSVVVVEDDPASADVLQRRLQANGMTVAVGRDGGEGLALVKKIVPDLVLLDVMLPDTDGYDLAARGQEDHRDVGGVPIALDAQADVVSVGVRQHHVEQDEVRHELLHEGEPFGAVATDGHGHAVRLQPPLKHIGGGRIVFDDDHPRRGLRIVRLHGHPVCSISPKRCFIAMTYFDGRSLTMCSRM